ncbi:hypothetical protein ACJZ2D_003588 [Fusarium nematophilum]
MGFNGLSRAIYKLGNKVSKFFGWSGKPKSESRRSRPNERVLQEAHAPEATSATRARYNHDAHGASPGEPHSSRGQSPSHYHTGSKTAHTRASQQGSSDRGHIEQTIRVAECTNSSVLDSYVTTNKLSARLGRAEMSWNPLSRSDRLEISSLGPLDALEAVLRDGLPGPSHLSIQNVARNDQRITHSTRQERGMRASISVA